MNAPITEAHRELAERIICSGESINKWAEDTAQLIADSEAKVVATVRHHLEIAERSRDSYSAIAHEIAAERDQLRAELARLDTEKPWQKEANATVSQLRAEVERLSSSNKDLRQSLRELGQERLEESLRADCLKQEVDRWVKWREEQPWLAEIHSYQQQVKNLADETQRLKYALSQSCDDEREMSISEGPGHSTCGLADELTERAERAEAALHAIQQDHGELGRYEKLRLKYAGAIAHADLMVDELKRILALVPEDSEIGDLCKRGIKNTYQHLPVLTQRDEAVQQALVMEAELAKERARLDHLDSLRFEHVDAEDGDHLAYEWTVTTISEECGVSIRSVIDSRMNESK